MKKGAGSGGKSVLAISILAGIFALDRLFKIYLPDGCLGIFCVRKTLNAGAAFGIFKGWTLLLVLAALVVLGIIASLYRSSGRMARWAFVLIAAGTVSNLVDRLLYGHVVDLFSVLGSSSFNLADLSNLAGAIILIYLMVSDEKEFSKARKGKKVRKQKKR